jgi:uncharacterized protein involved in response to NO
MTFLVGYLMGAVTVIIWAVLFAGSKTARLDRPPRCRHCHEQFLMGTSDAAMWDRFCSAECELRWMEERIARKV